MKTCVPFAVLVVLGILEPVAESLVGQAVNTIGCRFCFSLLAPRPALAETITAVAPPKVDFSYAFATPHRLTVGRPDASDRTLLDLQPRGGGDHVQDI